VIGRHERLHRTLKKEATRANILQQQAKFDAFLEEALGSKLLNFIDSVCFDDLNFIYTD
jgi:hypothetical protein